MYYRFLNLKLNYAQQILDIKLTLLLQLFTVNHLAGFYCGIFTAFYR